MSSSAIDKFTHRQNEDGTFDSICLSCFLTVANAGSELQLEIFERRHVCDEMMLRHFEAMRVETS